LDVIRTVGIVYNQRIPEALPLSSQLHDVLRAVGKTVWLTTAAELDRPDVPRPHLDLVVTLGGDGTILRATRLAAPMNALILGVNLGQLGFLAELGPGEVLEAVPLVMAGEGWIEERMMLRAVVGGEAARPPIDGLNDAVVSRGSLPRAIRVDVSIDHERLTTYVADGVIVSTATGSTAYALAMNGPVVHPELRTLQITPIAPHLTAVRSLVVPASAVVDLVMHAKEPGTISIDGQIDLALGEGDRVQVTASPHVGRFVRLRPRRYFYHTLVERLSTTAQRGMP